MKVDCNCNPYATSTDLHCEKCPYHDTCLLILPYDEEVDRLSSELRYYQRQHSEAINYKNYMMDFIKEFKNEGKHQHLLELFNHDLFEKVKISQPVIGSGNIPFFLIWIEGFSYNLLYEETYNYHIKTVHSLKQINDIVKGTGEYELLRKFILNTNICTDADDLLTKLTENIKTDCILKPEQLQDGVLNEILEDYKNQPIKEIIRTLRNKRKQAVDTINTSSEKIQILNKKLTEKQQKLEKQLKKEALQKYNNQNTTKNQTKNTDETIIQKTKPQKTKRKRTIYTKKVKT